MLSDVVEVVDCSINLKLGGERSLTQMGGEDGENKTRDRLSRFKSRY